MSDKPKIYSHCPAGCLWETVHMDDFMRSASHINMPVGELGFCTLEIGKEYKIFANKKSNGDFDIAIFLTHTGADMPFVFSMPTNTDAFADHFVFKFLGYTESGFEYEISGIRYRETLPQGAEHVKLYVYGATKVLLYNADATITGLKGKDGNSAFIRFSANADGTDFTETWTEGQNYIGFATGQKAPTDKSEYTWLLYVTEELAAKAIVPNKEGTESYACYTITGGKNSVVRYSVNPDGGAIAKRDDDGTLSATAPWQDRHLTTKKYVDDGFKTKADIIKDENGNVSLKVGNTEISEEQLNNLLEGGSGNIYPADGIDISGVWNISAPSDDFYYEHESNGLYISAVAEGFFVADEGAYNGFKDGSGWWDSNCVPTVVPFNEIAIDQYSIYFGDCFVYEFNGYYDPINPYAQKIRIADGVKVPQEFYDYFIQWATKVEEIRRTDVLISNVNGEYGEIPIYYEPTMKWSDFIYSVYNEKLYFKYNAGELEYGALLVKYKGIYVFAYYTDEQGNYSTVSDTRLVEPDHPFESEEEGSWYYCFGDDVYV